MTIKQINRWFAKRGMAVMDCPTGGYVVATYDKQRELWVDGVKRYDSYYAAYRDYQEVTDEG